MTEEQTGESAFRAIFEGAPVAIWDEDFSGVRQFVHELTAQGIDDIGEYFLNTPEALQKCVRRVRVRHVNPVALEFYGARTEQQLINSLSSLFDDAALDTFRREVVALAGGARSFTSEVSTITLRGERRRVVMNVRLVAPDPNWSRVVVAFTDITERRRLEQSLKRANESLHRLNQHLEQFAWAAAHDMREPLRTIALYAQFLRRHHPPAPGSKAETALRYMLDNATRMESLVEDLLTFARAVEAPEGQPDRCATDSRAVIAEVLSDLSIAIQESSAQIHVDSDLPVIMIRPVHLRQVFQNLLSNAIKYRAGTRQLVVRISAHLTASEVQFCVHDNGMGINPDYHQQIFGIFKRLHGLDIEGNGIGLALCRKIVEDCGGRIWVESDTDQGSRFYFTLPQEQDLV